MMSFFKRKIYQLSQSNNTANNTANTQSGFTLVELMVVVAIIGILAAVAIPNYQKYQARARQSEAKVALSGLYTAEQSYAVESATYTGCLNDIGFNLNANQRYYAVGFSTGAVAAVTCGAGTTACSLYYTGGTSQACTTTSASTNYQYDANAGVNSTLGATGVNTKVSGDTAYATIAKNSFKALAWGNVSTSNTVGDTWTITEAKALVNNVTGL